MRTIVTGGTGFIGSHFANHLLESTDDEVLILTRKNLKSENDRIEYLQGDLAHSLNLPTADWLVHFAAKTHVQESMTDSREFLKINSLGTLKLLEECKTEDINFIYISTEGVYGFSSKYKKENSKLNPQNPYAISKASGDFLTRFYGENSELDYRIIRMINNYGPRENEYELIPRIVLNALNDSEFKLFKPDLKQPFLYVKDSVRAIETIRKKGENGIYNVSTDEELKISEIAKRILEQFGKEHLFKGFKEKRLKDSGQYFMNFDKLKSLDWRPKFTFQEGIKRTIEWFENEKSEKID